MTRNLDPKNIETFTMDLIHAANPSKGWSMRSIQDQASMEFLLWSEEYVYDVVRSTVLKHCNLKE
jgi:hypothetical protein